MDAGFQRGYPVVLTLLPMHLFMPLGSSLSLLFSFPLFLLFPLFHPCLSLYPSIYLDLISCSAAGVSSARCRSAAEVHALRCGSETSGSLPIWSSQAKPQDLICELRSKRCLL